MSELNVGVAGATGAVGKEIVEVLERAPWGPQAIVPLASPATTVPFVHYRGNPIAVDDLAHQALDELDLLLLAIPDGPARSFGGQALDDGVPTVDCSGAFEGDDDVPLVVPWINPERLADAVSSRAARLPCAGALLLASVLSPLRRAGLGGEVDAMVLLGASAWGRSGVEELSRQVVTLFNSGTPPRKVFKEGLAFDLLPATGPVDDGGDSDIERAIRTQTTTLAGVEPSRVSAIGVPVFSGVSAQITIRATRKAPAELITQILADGGLGTPEDESTRSIPRPRSVEGEPFAQVGRIRVDPRGVLTLWASMDNLRATATTAVALGGALIQQDHG